MDLVRSEDVDSLTSDEASIDGPRAADSVGWWSGSRLAWLVTALCLAHFCLAQLYSAVIPYRTAGFTQGQFLPDIGAPDERAHANLIQHVVADKGYPLFDPASPTFAEDYQAHQPPAYYELTAAVLKVTGQTSIASPTAGRAARAVNGVLGALNVLGVFFLVRWMGRSARHAVTAAGIVALVPMNIALSAAMSNDPLLYVACTWSLAFLFRASRNNWPWRDVLLAALCAGLGLWTKTTAVLLIPAFAVAALWPRERMPLAKAAVLIALPLLMIAPWWSRNLQLYGDVLMTKTFERGFPSSFKTSPFRSDFAAVRWAHRMIEGTIESATGVFGYYDIHYPREWLFTIPALAVWTLSGIGIMAAWVAGLRKQAAAGFLFAVLVIVTFARFNFTYFQPQARYLFPFLPFLAWWMAEALGKFSARWTAVWIGLYVGLNVYTLMLIRPQFAEKVEAAVKMEGRR